ncbi:MAG: AI-2E family transporter [Anaerovoracaceae bacterium]
MEEKRILLQEGSIKEKMISWIILLVIFVTFWYMIDIVLLTFLLSFIFYHLLGVVQKSSKRLFSFSLPDAVTLSLLYVLVLSGLVVLGYELMPRLAVQFTDIWRSIIGFDIKSLKDIINPRLYAVLSSFDYNSYIKGAVDAVARWATGIGTFGLNIFIAVLLSYLLLLEKKSILHFGRQMANSKISFIYTYIVFFGGSFIKSFGKVMRVQVTISFINALVSMAGLAIMGFPQILGLGIMIFCLGLIPVAGVIISLAPLSMIAFSIGGIPKVVGILVMIAVIHGVEAYILNPKLMSNKTHLPVCFIFIVLLVAQHYMGTWGLLIGVPIFIFLLDLMEVSYAGAPKGRSSFSVRGKRN